MCPEAAAAEWIFPQEKSTFRDARKGYSYCGFALIVDVSICLVAQPLKVALAKSIFVKQ